MKILLLAIVSFLMAAAIYDSYHEGYKRGRYHEKLILFTKEGAIEAARLDLLQQRRKYDTCYDLFMAAVIKLDSAQQNFIRERDGWPVVPRKQMQFFYDFKLNF